MRRKKLNGVKIFINDLINYLGKVSKECDEFCVSSQFNDKKITIRYSVKGGCDVQR